MQKLVKKHVTKELFSSMSWLLKIFFNWIVFDQSNL